MIPPPENVAPSRLAQFGRLRSRFLRARVLEGAGGAKGGVSVRTSVERLAKTEDGRERMRQYDVKAKRMEI